MMTNQFYPVLLNAFEFKEITEVQNAHLKMLLEDDETRPRGCKYPTPPCARECFAHNRDISYFLNKSSFILVCIHAGNPRVPLGQNPAGQQKLFFIISLVFSGPLASRAQIMQYTVYLLYSHCVRIQELERKMIKALFNVKSGGVHSIEGKPVKYICCGVAHL